MTKPLLSDTELAAQPAAYWTGVAYEALIAFTRARYAELGFTQPQFWLLRNLSQHDLSPGGKAKTLSDLRQAMQSYLRAEDNLDAEAEILLERGWLARDGGGRLSITDAGEEARVSIKQHAPSIRAHIHKDVDDADYITALKVLRQMIRNTASAVLPVRPTASGAPGAPVVGAG